MAVERRRSFKSATVESLNEPMSPPQTDGDDDLRVLRGAARAAGFDPDGECCPDLEAIAATNLPIDQKVQRLREQCEDSIKRRRRGLR